MPKIVCMSDVHNKTNFKVPDGDIIVISGDLTTMGKLSQIEQFSIWLSSFHHKHKVVIAGNHDFGFEDNPVAAVGILKKYDIIYLQDSGITLEGLKFWGSPWQPRFYDWAFNADRGADIRQHWEKIPQDIDVLLTHGPPYGILDKTMRQENVGCEELEKYVLKIKPKLHVFGHIHPGYGLLKINDTIFVNASVCNEKYEPINPVQVIGL